MSRYRVALVSSVVLASTASLAVLVGSVAALPKSAAPHAVQATLGVTATMAVDRAAHTATARRARAGGRRVRREGFASGRRTLRRGDGRLLAPAADDRDPPQPQRHTPPRRYGAGRRWLWRGDDDVQTAELFDPRTQTFTRTGSLVSARADHIAVLLDNGTVLVAGGLGPRWTFLSSAEVYDPATRSFSPTGGMTVARESHTAVRLEDGRVFIAGGHRGRRADIVLHASAEVYDVSTGTFARVGDMGVRRHKHDAVRLRDGRVLITGGADERDSDGAYDTTELFDPAAGTFTPGPSMVPPRYKHEGASVLLPNGHVLIAGGAPQAETYDPARPRFTLVSGEARMAGLFSAVAPLPSDGALITGG